MSLLRHPTLPLIYIGIQRGGRSHGLSYPHANCYLAIYDLSRQKYTADVQLAEISNGRADDSTPACLTYDDLYNRIYVGMFQSKRGICVIEPESGELIQEIRFASNDNNNFFAWADPLSQTVSGNLLLSVNRNNHELVALDRASLQIKKFYLLVKRLTAREPFWCGEIMLLSATQVEMDYFSFHLEL